MPEKERGQMATKLWEKNFEVNAEIERFTVGRDRELDIYLARYDVLGSMAHIKMLQSIGLMEKDELDALLAELRNIYRDCTEGRFVIEDGVEDVHSQVELLLTRRLGDMGKKIHSGRSRNDQVLVDLKLFIRHELREIADGVMTLFGELQEKSEQFKDVLMPGYTHLQIAMPSSFGLWFGAYAESLADDMLFLQAAYRMANRNPLGSAAGYGSSFPLDREMTTRLLGFSSMDYNVVYAQMGRGKTERNVAFAMASVAGTLAKMAFDACLFNCQNFGFIRLPKECTTGSSIMPHKKNPDVFELIRAKCNKLQALPEQITLIMNNLPVGYFRDLQIIKEVFLPAFGELKDCLRMAAYIISKMEVNRNILDNPMYDPMFSVEEVNRLAAAGMPFRDAYRKVGMEIENGTYRADRNICHTHEGSMGNLCNDRIAELMKSVYDGFGFSRAEEAEKELLK
jgi:argininosuccinate lyase